MRWLRKALIQNKPDFVKIFLECGVHLDTFLTLENFAQLYDPKLVEDHSLGGSRVADGALLCGVHEIWEYIKKASVLEVRRSKCTCKKQ